MDGASSFFVNVYRTMQLHASHLVYIILYLTVKSNNAAT